MGLPHTVPHHLRGCVNLTASSEGWSPVHVINRKFPSNLSAFSSGRHLEPSGCSRRDGSLLLITPHARGTRQPSLPSPPTSPLPMPTPMPGDCSPQTSRILGNVEKERECAMGMGFGWFRRAALDPPDLQVLSDPSQAPHLCPKSGLSGGCSVSGLG